MNGSARRLGPLGWSGVLLCGLAVAVLAVLAVYTYRVLSGPSVHLRSGAQHVALPAHRTYGIYVDDLNNSGYSENCSATDAQGHDVEMRFPSWSISSSSTENLDLAYNTGSGDLTINCSVPGEIVTTRPVLNYTALLLGGLAAGALAVLGIVLIIIGVNRVRRTNSILPPHERVSPLDK